jgi:hypothetical protein
MGHMPPLDPPLSALVSSSIYYLTLNVERLDIGLKKEN